MPKTITRSRTGLPIASIESLMAHQAITHSAHQREHLQVALPLYAPAPESQGDDSASSDPYLPEGEIASDI